LIFFFLENFRHLLDGDVFKQDAFVLFSVISTKVFHGQNSSVAERKTSAIRSSFNSYSDQPPRRYYDASKLCSNQAGTQYDRAQKDFETNSSTLTDKSSCMIQSQRVCSDGSQESTNEQTTAIATTTALSVGIYNLSIPLTTEIQTYEDRTTANNDYAIFGTRMLSYKIISVSANMSEPRLRVRLSLLGTLVVHGLPTALNKYQELQAQKSLPFIIGKRETLTKAEDSSTSSSAVISLSMVYSANYIVLQEFGKDVKHSRVAYTKNNVSSLPTAKMDLAPFKRTQNYASDWRWGADSLLRR